MRDPRWAEKSREWLRALSNELGGQSETGIPQPQVSKILGGSRGMNLHQVKQVAKHHGREVAELIQEIENYEPKSPALPNNLESINRRFETVLAELFEKHPSRARRLALNIEYQDRIGLTDLISEMVRTVIELGPNEAAVPVAELLHKHEEVWTNRTRRIQSRFRKAYRDLEENEKGETG